MCDDEVDTPSPETKAMMAPGGTPRRFKATSVYNLKWERE
jgi:hypothetical protein